MNVYKLNSKSGFSLIELLVAIVVIGIIMSLAMQSMDTVVEDNRRISTKREMDKLALAITGNPDIANTGVRSDFGFIGDNGSFPSSLQDLYNNPGGWSTWDGPYISTKISQDSIGFKYDEWGKLYSYSGGITITSPGNGSIITKKLADSASDYISNNFNGIIKDSYDSLPGSDYKDSIDIEITIPNGSGSNITKIYNPESDGSFVFDSLPVGQHLINLIYKPANDTLTRFLNILPRHKSSATFNFASAYFSSGGGGGGPSAPTDLVGHWKLDDASGIIAYDYSGLGNNGTLINMDSTSDWVAGAVDNCLDFEGSNDHVFIPHIPELNGSTQLTYSAWIRPDNWSGIRQVMAKSVHGGGSGRAQMGIFSESGSLKGRAETNAGRYEVIVTLPPTSSWSMVALVFDSISLTLYVNDSIAGTTMMPNATLLQNNDELCISKRVGTDQYFFNGRIDDVRVYSRTLSFVEIEYLFSLGSP